MNPITLKVLVLFQIQISRLACVSGYNSRGPCCLHALLEIIHNITISYRSTFLNLRPDTFLCILFWHRHLTECFVHIEPFLGISFCLYRDPTLAFGIYHWAFVPLGIFIWHLIFVHMDILFWHFGILHLTFVLKDIFFTIGVKNSTFIHIDIIICHMVFTTGHLSSLHP